MKLLGNWREVVRKAWSIRLIVVAAVLSGLEVILPFLGGFLPIPQGLFAALSFVTVGGAFWARLVAQSNLTEED